MNSISYKLHDETVLIHPLKFIFIQEHRALLCADLHVGKGEHFRRHGVAIPRLAAKNNFWNLQTVIDHYKPEQLIVLGDMMHSDINIEWSEFTDFLDQHPGLKRILVRGNHEVYFDTTYHKMNFEVYDVLELNKLILTHEPMKKVPRGYYNLCGHIHPAVRLVGEARQSLRVPCFWFSDNRGVLPASGEFTGTQIIHPKEGDCLFLITGNKLIEKRVVKLPEANS